LLAMAPLAWPLGAPREVTPPSRLIDPQVALGIKELSWLRKPYVPQTTDRSLSQIFIASNTKVEAIFGRYFSKFIQMV
jgi:hypothetical protein